MRSIGADRKRVFVSVGEDRLFRVAEGKRFFKRPFSVLRRTVRITARYGCAGPSCSSACFRRDGTAHPIISPMESIERLAAPVPRLHTAASPFLLGPPSSATGRPAERLLGLHRVGPCCSSAGVDGQVCFA